MEKYDCSIGVWQMISPPAWIESAVRFLMGLFDWFILTGSRGVDLCRY